MILFTSGLNDTKNNKLSIDQNKSLSILYTSLRHYSETRFGSGKNIKLEVF